MTQCSYDPVTLTCTTCGHVARRLPTFRNCKPPPKPYDPKAKKPAGPPGPGHFTKRMLSWIGIDATEDCECGPMAAEMDARGPDWCESPEALEKILKVMRREHRKRRLLIPWSDAAAIGVVKTACSLARRAAGAARLPRYTDVHEEQTHGSGHPAT
jgi:hypothetical protein